MKRLCFGLIAAVLPGYIQANVLTKTEQTVSAYAPSSYGVSLSHYMGARDDSDPVSAMSLSMSWKVQEHWNIGVAQPFSKLYVINSGEEEFTPSDTRFSLSRSFEDLYQGWDLSAGFGLTAPVSEFSRLQGVLTKTSLSLSLSQGFFDDALSVSIGPGFGYQFNRYSTTKTDNGSNGGNPMRQYNWSFGGSASYKILEKLSANSSIAYTQVYYEDLGLRSKQGTATGNALLNEDYAIDLSLAYQLTDKIALKGGYNQSDIVEKLYGRQEVYFFDEYATQYYVGMNAVF